MRRGLGRSLSRIWPVICSIDDEDVYRASVPILNSYTFIMVDPLSESVERPAKYRTSQRLQHIPRSAPLGQYPALTEWRDSLQIAFLTEPKSIALF